MLIGPVTRTALMASPTVCMPSRDQQPAVVIQTAVSLLGYVAELLSWARQLSVGTEDISRAPDSVWSHSVSSQSLDSSGALFLAPSVPPHILPFHPPLLSVSFPPAALSLPGFFGCPYMFCLSHLFYIFCFLPLFWSSLVSHLLCPDHLSPFSFF